MRKFFFLAWICMTLGLVVMAGWIFNLPALQTLFPGFIAMKFNTAVCFFLSGAALWISMRESQRVFFNMLMYFCIALVLILTTLTVCEYAFRIDLHIDEFILRDKQPYLPGRMAPLTAVNFIFSGLAFFLMASHRTTARILNSCAMAVSLLALFGYAYGIIPFYSPDRLSGMAFHTVLGFLALGMGIFFLRPNEGFMKIVLSPTSAGKMIRVLLPASILLPLAIGWVRQHGENVGLYSPAFGTAFAMTLIAFLMALMVCAAGWNIYRLEKERQKLESRFYLAEKISAVGQLAAGLGHEVNNPLTVIFGYSRILKEEFPDNPLVQRSLDHIESQAKRLRDLVQLVSIFSRQTAAGAEEVFNLPEAVEEVLAADKPPGVLIVKNFESKLPLFSGRKVQIQQAIKNIYKNAVESMPAGGRLGVYIRKGKRNGEDGFLIEIEDSGEGISLQNQSKIFNPFFTTKGPDKGTGLGLSIAHEIIKNHGGDISFSSTPGERSLFCIHLPFHKI